MSSAAALAALVTSASKAVDDLAHRGDTDVTWRAVRRVVNEIAADKGEWGGAPIPMEHVRLVMEPRYPFPGLSGFKLGENEPARAPRDFEVINEWFDYRRGAHIYVIRKDGRSVSGYQYSQAGSRLTYWFNTLGVAAGHAWDMDVESRAIEKLKELITEHAFHCYMLTGSFLETSKRSGVCYLFRKLRPTIAMKGDENGQMKVLSILCLHPLGYYEQSWAGVMCPTDDVVAHLMLMRGDEKFYWRKANHHDMAMASAGI